MSYHLNNRLPVAVLGGTGTVGQRFVSLLEQHPWFKVVAVTGSERSIGRRYGEAVRWVIPGSPPPDVAELSVLPTLPDLGVEVSIVFSALPTAIARTAEPEFAAAGHIVCKCLGLPYGPGCAVAHPGVESSARRVAGKAARRARLAGLAGR